MIGYSSESKAFKMFDPIEKKSHVSRDLIFEEEKKWKWDESYSSEQNMELEWEDEYECVENENEEEEVEAGESDKNGDQSENSPSLTQVNTEATSSTVGRLRRPPIWHDDYTHLERNYLMLKLRQTWRQLVLKIQCSLSWSSQIQQLSKKLQNT